MPELETIQASSWILILLLAFSYDAFPVFELPSLDGIEIEIPA